MIVLGRSKGTVNGTAITNEYVHVFEMRDGKAARVTVYADPTDTARALEG